MLSIFIQHSSAKLAMRRSLCRLCCFSSLLRRNNAIQGTGAKQHQAEQKKLQSNFEAAVAAFWQYTATHMFHLKTCSRRKCFKLPNRHVEKKKKYQFSF